MVGIHSAETVGCAFTEQYYQVLYHRPEDTHKFYKNSSVAGWEGKDGVVHSVTTMEGINEMIMSSDYKDSDVQVNGIYAQDSLQGSILLVVTGIMTGKDGVMRKFSHTFLLARQERGFFVLNDILRFVDTCPPLSASEAGDDNAHKVAESPSSTNSDILEHVEVSEKACAQQESKVANSESKLIPSSCEKMTTEPLPKPSANSVQLKSPPPAVVSDNAKDTTAPKTTYLEKLSKENKCPQTQAIQIVRVSASDGRLIEAKAQAPISNNDSIKKTSLHSNNVPKAAPPPVDETTENIAKGIYVGGLPPNTTKHELTEAVKIFGRVKKNDGVQVIDNKNEDGFTYGFVHFESEESAHKAVEAHNITIRGKEAYITYKKSNTRGGNGSNGRWAPPGRGGSRGGGPHHNSGRGSYNGYPNGGREDGGFYEYEYRSRSSDGRERDGYQWNGGRRGSSRGGGHYR